ncbi:MAG: lipid-binding SYLF domain-containing protein [Candidatus Acidiferrales bacterium]
MVQGTSGYKGRLTDKVRIPFFVIALLVAMLALPALAGDEEKDVDTLKNATAVFQEMVNRGDIPANVLAQANCVIVLPGVKKVGIGIGGSGGRGPMSCRLGDKFNGKWSAPAMYSIGGASVGLQLGATSSDFVILVTTEKGVHAILEDKTKLGTDATAAAGPGATAQSNTVGGADVYTYGRAKGLFAGVSLDGATLHQDRDANQRLYGKKTGAREIVRTGDVKPPAGGDELVSLLNSKVPNHSN